MGLGLGCRDLGIFKRGCRDQDISRAQVSQKGGPPRTIGRSEGFSKLGVPF